MVLSEGRELAVTDQGLQLSNDWKALNIAG